ncbi:MerR family transcriptional regulator [Streptomyces sp. HC44]|uniref:MerR family transcriptional regulator n=1 Tax=Streptomyces scabichelini TaxID=2711217 RepID=A0A6G4V8W4_9ACTN|nr:MerR family transcriptional regulator [Streptomyces scabichelini]NGO10267.1 MerR family transcriptional regulator [Streptomyces scabichelini]
MSTTTSKSPTAYGIGEVAARFGVAVSTLRWWERCGLVTPARTSGRRTYSDADVRRIAVVQLLQKTTMMSLPEISALLAGSGNDRDWRTAVRARVTECEEQLARLTAARAYLAHLLSCPSDHPTDQCPYLAQEIDGYLATGRISSPPDPVEKEPSASPSTP